MKTRKILKIKGDIENFSFSSMAQAAGTTGVSMPMLQLAKSKGCVAFRQSRIYLLPLVRFLFAQDREDLTDWKARGQKFTALLAEASYLKTTGEVISKTVALECLEAILSVHFTGYERALQELPGQLAGRTAGEIRETLSKFVQDTREAERTAIAALAAQAGREAAKAEGATP